jgi:hypothetical protein
VLIGADRDKLLILGPHWYTAQSLGDCLELSLELRTKLGVTTIRPDDHTWAEVTAIQQEKRKMKKREVRRAEGRSTRTEWLAENSTSRDEPWEKLNMSRRTWYRRGKPTPPLSDATVAQVWDEHTLVIGKAGPVPPCGHGHESKVIMMKDHRLPWTTPAMPEEITDLVMIEADNMRMAA